VSVWTLVSRRKGGRFYRPVGNVPAGLDWESAYALSRYVPETPDTQVWYVPRVSSFPEDVDNVLEDGRRIPIRWDAAPLVFLPLPLPAFLPARPFGV
jgi:hypothetical protein